MADTAGGNSVILHYSGGLLTAAKLPVAATKIDVTSIAAIPGTTEALAGGFTHAAFAPATNSLSAILQFKS
jgi:hypothetical protein